MDQARLSRKKLIHGRTLSDRFAYIYSEGAVRQASARRTLRSIPPQLTERRDAR